MGVPDLRGGLGTSTFYTTDATAPPRESENVVRVSADGRTAIATHLIGPRNPKDRADLTFERRPCIDPTPRRRRRRSARRGRRRSWRSARGAGATGSGSSSRSGCSSRSAGSSGSTWSGSSRSSSSMPRRSTSTPTPRCSRSARRRTTPGSWPRRSGTFYTTGMVEDHAGLNNERFGEEAFLDQCDDAWRRARGDDAPRAGAVRRGPLLLPLRHARPGPAHVLAVPRARPSGQPGRGPAARAGRRRSRTTTGGATRSSARRSSTPTTRRWSSSSATTASAASGAAST